MGLQGDQLSKLHRKKIVLNHVSLTLEPGECLGILGDNGSGKSTLMSILAGMQSPTQGSVLLDGAPLCRSGLRRIGYVPQTPVLIDDLSVRDNLALWQAIYKLDASKGVLHTVPDCLSLGGILTKKVSTLSGGMAKKVAIAIAVMHSPDYLILDEAFAALDAKTVASMVDYLKDSSMGILYSSHNIQEIAALCNRVAVLCGGELVYHSPPIPHFDEAVIQQLTQYF